MPVTTDPVMLHTTVGAEMVLKIAPHSAPWLLSVQLSLSSAVCKLMVYCCWFEDEIHSPLKCLNRGDSCIHKTLKWEDGEWMTKMGVKLTGSRLTSWRLKLCIQVQSGCWPAGTAAACVPVTYARPDLKGSPIPITFGYRVLCWGRQQNNAHCCLLQ